jgi:RHS repeat-associated protein
MVYKNGQPYQLSTPEGRATNVSNAWFYEYNIKDHLGNVRVSFKSNSGVLQQVESTNYDPFGIELNGTGTTNSVENRFKYQDKESLTLFGLSGINDFGARYYDKTIGRWWGVDALAEKRFNLTPYHYVSNNPINRIDLFGLEDVNGDGKDDGTILPEVTVTARKRDISSSWSNYINNLGNEGYNSFKEIYREHKLSPYNSNFSGAIYGRDANGQVQIPDDILDRIDQEVDDEAMLALAMLWASEQSGVDPDSFNFDINPFARANFYNSYLSTGLSSKNAKELLKSLLFDVAVAWGGKLISPRTPKNSHFGYGYKIGKFDFMYKNPSVDGGTIVAYKGTFKFRVDFHHIDSKVTGWSRSRIWHYHTSYGGRSNSVHRSLSPFHFLKPIK